jgi:hypothetical protein
MELGLTVFFIVLGATIVLAVLGVLINGMAERHERSEGR